MMTFWEYTVRLSILHSRRPECCPFPSFFWLWFSSAPFKYMVMAQARVAIAGHE